MQVCLPQLFYIESRRYLFPFHSRLQQEVAGLTGDLQGTREELSRVSETRDSFKQRTQEYCRALEELGAALAAKVIN